MRMIVVVLMLVSVVVIMAVLLRVRSFQRPALHEDAKAGPRETAAGGLAALDRDSRQAQPGHDVGEHVEGHPQIEAGTEEHVAGDAAAAIQVVARHGAPAYHAPFSRCSLSEAQRPRLPRTTWSARRRPTISAASSMRRVKRRSSALGEGSPLGWVWKR